MGMVDRNNNIVTYERKRKKMSETSNQITTSTAKTKEGLTILQQLLTVGGIVVGAIFYIASQGKDIEALEDDVKEIKENYSNIDDKIDELSSLVSDDHEMFLELVSMNTEERPYTIVLKDKYQIKTVKVENEEYLAAPTWEEGNIIASDVNGDTIYNPEDLYNVPIITSYLDGDNEVYFYGRFNENNRWNGKCILNTYNENKLVSIFEGIYDNGELFRYRTASTENQGTIWWVNDRINQGEYNSGETWTYTKTDDYTKGFTMEDVKEKQIVTVDKFFETRNENLLSYYKGNTANGLYNDDTGKAYLITYFTSGELDDKEAIKTFYQGKFVKGHFEDSSDKAWYITREISTTYMYYEGSFSGGTADHKNEKEFENYIRYDYIVDKLKEKGFEEYSSEFFVEYSDDQ